LRKCRDKKALGNRQQNTTHANLKTTTPLNGQLARWHGVNER
jgi:hypothetical protein